MRTEVAAIGDRLAEFRAAADAEIERLAAFRWLTELAELGPSEVAERAGVSRQTLANLRSQERGADHQWPTDLRVLLELGLRGPQSAEQVIGSLAQPPVHEHQVMEALERLTQSALIGELGRAASGATEPVVYLRLTPLGIEDLPRRLRHAAMPPSRAWTAYVTSSPGEANAMVGAGRRALGERGAFVIPAGTVRGMTRPEVAFTVEATDPRTAVSAAVRQFHELREHAGMAPRQEPVVVAALIPPARAGAAD